MHPVKAANNNSSNSSSRISRTNNSSKHSHMTPQVLSNKKVKVLKLALTRINSTWEVTSINNNPD